MDFEVPSKKVGRDKNVRGWEWIERDSRWG